MFTHTRVFLESQPDTQREKQRGSSSVAALGIIAALLLILTVIAGLITVSTVNQQAMAAADLAALAAADTARGLRTGDPCEVAGHIAATHKAQLVGCTQPLGRPGTVDVRVHKPLPGAYSWLGPAEAVSRAGPPG